VVAAMKLIVRWSFFLPTGVVAAIKLNCLLVILSPYWRGGSNKVKLFVGDSFSLLAWWQQ